MTCSRHLNLTDFGVGASCSIALQGKAKTGYPRMSRGSFLSNYGSFLCYYIHFLYILFPSSRILVAAFTSRSIRFPHSHRYVRSDNASSFFLCPHTLHILLDPKYLSAGQVPEAAKDAAGKNKTPPYDPGGMEAEISDCEQGTIREIFCQPVVRL